MLKVLMNLKRKLRELTVIISNSDSNNKTYDLDRLKKGKKLSLKKTLKDTVKILVKESFKKIIYDICLSLKK